MAADAMAPCIAKPSAAEVLTMKDKFVFVFLEEGLQLTVPPQCQGQKIQMYFCASSKKKKNSAHNFKHVD